MNKNSEKKEKQRFIIIISFLRLLLTSERRTQLLILPTAEAQEARASGEKIFHSDNFVWRVVIALGME
jgi:hypothetical protein